MEKAASFDQVRHRIETRQKVWGVITVVGIFCALALAVMLVGFGVLGQWLHGEPAAQSYQAVQ